MELFKRYVDMEVTVSKEGHLIPDALIWVYGMNEKRYAIDRVLSGPEQRASQVGGAGKRYTILVQGEKRNIFQEHCKDPSGRSSVRWFIESKKP